MPAALKFGAETMRQPRAKYLQIKEHLLRGIASRRFQKLLPSENELAKRFGVSRMTARRALSHLVNEGYAQRVPKKGTFVKRQLLTQGFFRIPSHRMLARKLDLAYRIKLLQVETVAPPAEVAAILGSPQAILVRRIHSFDQKPVTYEKRYLHHDICNEIVWENLEKESLMDILVSKLNIPVTNAWQRLEAIVLSEQDAAYFDVAAGGPAFCLERVLYSFERPICRTIYVLRGDVFAFEDSFSPQSDKSQTFPGAGDPSRRSADGQPALPDEYQPEL